MTFLAGKLHQFTFSVQKSLETGDYELKLTNETVTAWENDSKSHNGEAREYLVVDLDDGQSLEEAIQARGINPEKTHNLEVPGSSPGWSTLRIKHLRISRKCFFFFSDLQVTFLSGK